MPFEVLRTYNGKPFEVRAHQERLYASLKLLEIDCGLSINQMEATTLDALDHNRSTEPNDVDWWVSHGVSRATTIQLAQELEIPFLEQNLDRYDALTADEIVLTSTSFTFVHARSFEGQIIGDGKPGPITRRLIDAWKKHVGLAFVAQAHDYASRVAVWEKKQKKW